MRTARAAAGICASWTKACGGKGQLYRRPHGRGRGQRAASVERRRGAALPRPHTKASGCRPPFSATTALLKCQIQIQRTPFPFLQGLMSTLETAPRPGSLPAFDHPPFFAGSPFFTGNYFFACPVVVGLRGFCPLSFALSL